MGRQLRLDLETAPTYGRDELIRSPANEAAVRALDAWPDALGGVLAIVGPPGSGKTHLAAIWSERTGAMFFSDVAAELADLPELEGRAVIVDDADRVDDETLFHLINQTGTPGSALLLTSRSRPAAWPAGLRDLRSRLDAIRTVELGAPDDALLRALLQRHFERRAVNPSAELLDYLVRRIERSATAAREVVFALEQGAGSRRVTRALAQEILEIETESGDLFG